MTPTNSYQAVFFAHAERRLWTFRPPTRYRYRWLVGVLFEAVVWAGLVSFAALCAWAVCQ